MNANYTEAQEALSIIHSGNRVFVQGSAQTPVFLLQELAKTAGRYIDVELVFMSVYGDLEIDKPQYVNNFRIIGQGTGNNFLVHEIVHLTINANGTATNYVDNFSIECK